MFGFKFTVRFDRDYSVQTIELWETVCMKPTHFKTRLTWYLADQQKKQTQVGQLYHAAAVPHFKLEW